jgi:pimeloyl-ACP methyl ester carboxylesterase
MTPVFRQVRKKQQVRFRIVVLIGLGFLFGLLYVVTFSKSGKNSFMMGTTTTPKTIQTGALEYSVYGDVHSVAYYHCASQTLPEKSKHLVLLHGAKFTKEEWKTSGIMETLCENPNLSVSAIDLSVRAGHRDLMGMLLAMKDSFQINLPVVLVTPSASGMTITDWMATGRLPDLPNFVQKWIPVACFAVSAATEDQLARMARLNDFEVLAIYGNKDRGGEETAGRLEDYVGAQTLELNGGHSCYLDSPEEFCSALVKELGV